MGAVLPRALESVKDFAEVIIADGGSTDDTREVAERYGARVIAQSNPGQPVTDFSLERNRILDVATQPWFFWLDSDEFISDELHDEIAAVVGSSPHSHTHGPHRSWPAKGDSHTCDAYRIRIERCDPDTLKPYIDLKPNYQVRLVRTDIGARYVNKIHEHIHMDKAKYSVGTLKGAWYVPLDKLAFTDHKRAVDARFPALVREKPPHTLGQYFRKGILRPLTAVAKIVTRAVLLRVLHPFGHVVPLSLERNRIHTQWVIARESLKAFLKYRG